MYVRAPSYQVRSPFRFLLDRCLTDCAFRMCCTGMANGRLEINKPLAAFRFEGVLSGAKFLWVFPPPAASAFLLAQPGFVLLVCPLVPSQVAFWRLVAGFEIRLYAHQSARYSYACHIKKSPSNGLPLTGSRQASAFRPGSRALDAKGIIY